MLVHLEFSLSWSLNSSENLPTATCNKNEEHLFHNEWLKHADWCLAMNRFMWAALGMMLASCSTVLSVFLYRFALYQLAVESWSFMDHVYSIICNMWPLTTALCFETCWMIPLNPKIEWTSILSVCQLRRRKSTATVSVCLVCLFVYSRITNRAL